MTAIIGILVLGIVIGVCLTLIVGAFQHEREMKQSVEYLTPELANRLAELIIEKQKLKELES